ncbi:MAG: ATP-binding protein [Burkholderiales bacterium]|nr:ATP-binding protein [Burkholderiales bacterium]
MPTKTESRPAVASIGWRLATLVLACAIPAVVAAVLLIAYNYQQEKEHSLQAASAQARAVVNSLDREFASVHTALYTLGTSRRLATGDYAGFHLQAVSTLKNLKAWNIVLTEASGQQLVNTALPFGAALPVDGQPARAKGLFDTAQPVVSDLFFGKVAKRRLFSVIVPIVEENEVTHALGAGVTPEAAAELLRQQNLPPDWIAAVFDSTGSIVARSHQLDQYLGQKATPNLLQRLQSQPEGSFEGTTLEGVKVFTSFARSPTTGWGVALGIPRAGVMQNLWMAVTLAVAVVAVLLAAGFIAAWHIGSRISESIFELAKPAFALGHGVQVDVPPLYFREANVLGEALTTASNLLQQASEAVDRRDARMGAILESAMDAIITVDEDQRVVLYNRAAAEMFGWAREEAIGRPLSQFIPQRLHQAHAAHLLAFGSGNVPHRQMGERRAILGLKRDGREFPIEASISKIVEGDSNLFTVVLRDISERVKAQQALERSNEELRQFAFVASHDLKGPLRSIGGFAQLVEREYGSTLDARGIDLLRRMSKAAARMEHLTDDLLLLAQVEAEAPALVPVRCGEVIDEVVQLLERPIRDAGATVTAPGLPTVQGNRNELVHLFLNLVSNAIKFHGAQAPVVTVSAERSGDDWVVSVADNGIGIEPAHLERIFDVFSRLHRLDDYDGTGIGLALCRKIATRHGGSIRAESAPGQGSTFRVTLKAA